MRNGLKRVLSFMLVVFMLVPLFGILPAFASTVDEQEAGGAVYDPTTPEKTGGKSFNADNPLTVENALSVLPYTIEAEVQLSTGITDRGGVIFGNYMSSSVLGVSVEAYYSGQIRLYSVGVKGKITDVVFDKIDIRGNDYVKVSIAIDENNQTATCYVSGASKAQKQEKPFSYSTFKTDDVCMVPTNPYRIGGDYRPSNDKYFRGKIKSVSVYGDTRTEDEIKAGTNLSDEALLLAYDLEVNYKNLSKLEGYDLVSNESRPWEEDGALSFSSANTYEMAKPFENQIYTYEAMVWIPTSVSNDIRVGAVCGNYSSSINSTVFEFVKGAAPRLYFQAPNGARYDFTFNNVDARANEWTFVTVVLDTTLNEARCYINGDLKQTIKKDSIIVPDETYETVYHLGNDTRGASGYPFQGGLKSLALYSEVRTEDEIKADMLELNKDADGVVAMYEFTEDTGRSDISGNGYHIYYNGETRLEDEGSEEGGEVIVPAVEGLEFTSSTIAAIQKKFPINSKTLTLEASVLLPTTHASRGGIILGNYKGGNNHYFSFEIHNNGNPRISITKPNDLNNRYEFVFNKVDVRGESGAHVAITLNQETGEAVCYLNGEEKQTITLGEITIPNGVNNQRMVLGNDLRTSDIQNFKGTIGSVAVYTDIRTESEIKADAAGINPENDNLEIYYNLKGATIGQDIEDLSGNGYTVKFGTRVDAEVGSWLTEKEEVKDYLYSFAVVGDTQIIANRYGSQFGKIYDWILDNKDSKKIGYVFGLGDITDGNSSSEWALASTHILNRLSGVIPYSVVRGNHDGKTQFNSVFANEIYMSQFDGFYEENSVLNTYRYFEIEGTKYLMITLDYGASDDVLNWAGDIIKANKDRKVIITTHAYLYRDGTTLDQGDVCPPATSGGYNNGDHMWDKLIAKYENIYLVMSGHDPCANVVVTQTEGANGNIVTQILTDHQGVDANSAPTGMVTMLYFMADGSIEVETYSTIQEKYYLEENQFTIEETEHNYVNNPVYAYENGYLQKGTVTMECDCGATRTFETNALITFKGYSIAEGGISSVVVGYTINYKQIEVYENAVGTKINLGVVACASDSLVNLDNKPVNSDGSVAQTTIGTIANQTISTTLTNVTIIMKTESWEKYADKNIIMCLYIIENEVVSYASGKEITEAAQPITYNQVLSEQEGRE